MKAAAIALVLLGACGSSGDDYGGTPGGGRPDANGSNHGDGGSNQPIDAPPGLDAPQQFISGKVCRVDDLRHLDACPVGLAGVKVELGTHQVTTDDHGLFSMEMPTGADLYWRVSSTDIVTTIMPLGETALLPAFDHTTYDNLLAANGPAVQQPGRGSLVLRVLDATTHGPKPNVGGVPISTYGPFYEGANATMWNGTRTGASGIIWYVDLASGQLTSTVQAAGGTPTNFGPVRIAGDTITFFDVTL